MIDADKAYQEQEKKDAPSLSKTVFKVPKHILLIALIMIAILWIAYSTKSIAWLSAKTSLFISLAILVVIVIVGSANQVPDKPERVEDNVCRALLIRELKEKQRSGMMPQGMVVLDAVSSGNDTRQGYEIGWSLTYDYLTSYFVTLWDWYDNKYVTTIRLSTPYDGNTIIREIPKYIPITPDLFYKSVGGYGR